MNPQIYLDNAATTMVDPRVVERMLPTFTVHYGNPSSAIHSYGRDAAELFERAHWSVAQLINATSPKDVIFTSGATESNDLAIRGVIDASAKPKKHVITTKIEHPSVLATCERLEAEGVLVTYLDVNRDGLIDAEDIRRAMRPETALVSVMAANNEVGTLQPIDRVAQIARERGVFFHTDATQFAGSGLLDVVQSGVDLASFSAHKFYGPKGIGALYVRRSSRPVRIASRINGGGQQNGLRAGTINVPGVVGLGAAAELACGQCPSEWDRIGRLRDRLLRGLQQNIAGVSVNGSMEHRIATNLNVSIQGVSSLALISAAKTLAFSAGSACSSGSGKTSHVLAAMGLSRDEAKGAIRFGLGRYTTEWDIECAIGTLSKTVDNLRTSACAALQA